MTIEYNMITSEFVSVESHDRDNTTVTSASEVPQLQLQTVAVQTENTNRMPVDLADSDLDRFFVD